MRSPELRQVENDVPPERERLSEEETEAVRADCRRAIEEGTKRLVDSCPPRVPTGPVRYAKNGPTLYIGLLGQAFGFLHLYERSGDSGQLRLARAYLDAAAGAIARSGYAPPSEWLSFHATGGFSAIAAVLADRQGDRAESDRHLARYLGLASVAAAPDYPTEDLLWGRSGFLFGAAFLREHLGRDRVDPEQVAPALEAMIATGRRHASAHARDLTPGPHGRTPLLYLNLNASVIDWFTRAAIGSAAALPQWLARQAARVATAYGVRAFDLAHRYDLSLVHGLPGNLYVMMHFPELLAARPASEEDVRKSLDCLTDYLDAEQGMPELLPSPRSDASQKRRRVGRFTDRVHWCGGTPGLVFTFSRAFTVFGDATYREAAERAADHVWKNGLVCKGNGICHGIAGNGYAFLALYRATGDPRALDRALHFARLSQSPRVTEQQRTPDRPWSLYEGLMGTLCFYADCLDPARARFPAFEV